MQPALAFKVSCFLAVNVKNIFWLILTLTVEKDVAPKWVFPFLNV